MILGPPLRFSRILISRLIFFFLTGYKENSIITDVNIFSLHFLFTCMFKVNATYSVSQQNCHLKENQVKPTDSLL